MLTHAHGELATKKGGSRDENQTMQSSNLFLGVQCWQLLCLLGDVRRERAEVML